MLSSNSQCGFMSVGFNRDHQRCEAFEFHQYFPSYLVICKTDFLCSAAFSGKTELYLTQSPAHNLALLFSCRVAQGRVLHPKEISLCSPSAGLLH